MAVKPVLIAAHRKSVYQGMTLVDTIGRKGSGPLSSTMVNGLESDCQKIHRHDWEEDVILVVNSHL